MHDTIRKLRKERGLTQKQVADHLQIDRSTYAYYESGRTRINIDVIIKLAQFYQVRYAALLGPEKPRAVAAQGFCVIVLQKITLSSLPTPARRTAWTSP